MIGKQDGLAFKERHRVRIQVIRMAVRKPDERTVLDRRLLRFGNFMAECPAAEIRKPLDPRVRYKKRLSIVIDDDRGIADRLKRDAVVTRLHFGQCQLVPKCSTS